MSVQTVAFAPDGKTLAWGRLDGVIGLLEAATGKVGVTREAHTGMVSRVRFSEDGKTLHTVGLDGTVGEWDAGTMTLRATHNVDMSQSWKLALAPDGKMLAMTSTSTNRIRVWDAARGKVRQLTSRTEKSVPITAIVFAPDGLTLASGHADGTLSLWDPASGKEMATFGGDQGQITALAFSANGRTLASADVEAVVKL
jgi:WD40 repeat protein